MLGIAFHPPNLVNLMVDRERFTTVVVPEGFSETTQEVLEELFSKSPRKGTRRLLLVEKISTLNRVASHFPEAKVKIIVFDVPDNLRKVTKVLVDVTEEDGIQKLVSVKPASLNPALMKLHLSVLEDFRKDFSGDAVITLASREGRFLRTLQGASVPLQTVACKYLLGLSNFASLKRASRKDASRVNSVQQFIESDYGVPLAHAFMDMSLYGTESKEAAIFAEADLEDLQFIVKLVAPEADLSFQFELPEKLRIARE